MVLRAFNLDSNYLVNHVQQSWEKHGDSLVTGLPLMSNPFAFWALLINLVIIAKVIAPKFAKPVSQYDLKPWMLTFNGFVFGLCGVGFCMGFPITNLGMDSFACNALDPKSTNIQAIGLKYIAFMYTLIKLMAFCRPIVASLRGRNDHTNSYAYLGYLVCQASMAYLGAIFYPGGIFALLPLADDFSDIFTWGYLTLMIPKDSAFRPGPVWRNIVIGVRYLASLALFVQGVYFLNVPNCGWPFLKNFITGYNLLVVVAMTRNFFVVSEQKCTKSN